MSTAVAVVLFCAVTAYAIFGGADFGAGFWDLLAGGSARGERPREVIDHSIGPVWEANHVWLIFVFVVLWTGFSEAYASITLTLFVPLTLAAFGIVLRGSSFAFRKTVFRTRDRRNFGATFALSSVLVPYWLTLSLAAGDDVGRPGLGGAPVVLTAPSMRRLRKEIIAAMHDSPQPTEPSQPAEAVNLPQVLGAPIPSPAERRAAGRARRVAVPRSVHGAWEPAPDRRDPVEIVVEVCRPRLPDLVPVHNRRMISSSFAFFRGSALQMALDLATTPSSGIDVHLCGDAHLMNFGVFASPERTLVFDLNDFDETSSGPFEWDVKRLAASALIAARELGMTPGDQAAAAKSAVRSYRTWIDEYAGMTHLDVWYAKLDAQVLLDLMAPPDRRSTKRELSKALRHDHTAALSKLTEVVDGRIQIVPNPPFVTRRADDPAIARQLPGVIEEYRSTLQSDRQALFDRFHLVDIARKVVGVGSVGTRCWILLFQGPNGGPLFLQAKEAGASVLELAGLPGPTMHPGHRVVDGQRQLQSASDVLLGWTTAPEYDTAMYLRQLWDAKGSVDLAGMTPSALTTYAGACGWALARAHARTGDSSAIAGYLGRTARFDDAVTAFAQVYADQNERDHAALCKAAADGVVPVSPVA